jgi:alpha-L-fucosidase
LWDYYVDWGKDKGTAKQEEFNRAAEKMTERYVPTMVRSPNGTIWSPGMVDVPLRGDNKIHNWFWAPDQDHAVYSREKLVDIYYKSVGRNANLLIGAVVTPDGLVPAHDIQRLKEFGDEIKSRFGKPLAKTKGTGKVVQLNFSQNQKVNHVIIQEDISQGERVRNYTLEGLVDGNWKPISTGESIGHKRIEQFSDMICKSIRLNIHNQIAEPKIRNLSAFAV